MLERPGDLIPVNENAITIPWTKRRSQILNFLHRGPVNFNTLVYDTNVGDISSLATYFNPDRISERELNLRFGNFPASCSGEEHESSQKYGLEEAVKPRLLLYPDHNLNPHQAKAQRTLNWVLSNQDGEEIQRPSSLPQTVLSQESVNDDKEESRPSSLPSVPGGLMGLRPESTDLVAETTIKESVAEAGEVKPEDVANHLEFSLPVSMAEKPRLLVPKSATLPNISLSAALDNLWAEKSEGAFDDTVWAEGGLGLGGLADRVNKSTDVLGDKWLGAWDSTNTYSW